MSEAERSNRSISQALLSVPQIRLEPLGRGAVGVWARRAREEGEERVGSAVESNGFWEFVPDDTGTALGLAAECCSTPANIEQRLMFQMEQLGVAYFGSRPQALAARAAVVTGQPEGFFAENTFGDWNVYCYAADDWVTQKCGTIVVSDLGERGDQYAYRCRFMPTPEGFALGFQARDNERLVGQDHQQGVTLGQFFDEVVSQGAAARAQLEAPAAGM